MALIDCSECGNKVSDKALSCPQCGKPPPTKPLRLVCAECGQEVSDKAASCAECGHPTFAPQEKPVIQNDGESGNFAALRFREANSGGKKDTGSAGNNSGFFARIIAIVTIIFVGYGTLNFLGITKAARKAVGADLDEELVTALTPGVSRREQFQNLVDEGGLGVHNKWAGFTVGRVENIKWNESTQVLKEVALYLDSYPPPVPNDIMSALSRLCGIKDWKSNNFPGGKAYSGNYGRYQCGYMHRPEDSTYEVFLVYKGPA